MVTSKEDERLLTALEKIESAVARIYQAFAECDRFTDSAKKCWSSIVEAELKHARLFRELRERAARDGSMRVEVEFPLDQLKRVIQRLKRVREKIARHPVSESEAYSVGAFIEETLSEFSFSKRVRTDDAHIRRRIKEVENDTQDHYILLHNCSLGRTGSLRPQPPNMK
jgi:hypothetical protein